MTAGDWTVERFIETLVVPRRHREPRTAEALAGTAPTFVDTRWGPVASWRLGAGPATLLVHGFEDDHSVWSPLIDRLVDHELSLIALDLPAHGASGGSWGMGWEAADAIRAVAEALSPVNSLVAHSFGCGAAVGAMAEGLQLDRAVFIAPPLQSDNRWTRYARKLNVDLAIATAAARTYHEAVGAHRSSWTARRAYPAVDADVLVVHSRTDERAPFDDAAEVVALCQRARLLAIDGPSHRRTAREPLVIEEIVSFLAAGCAPTR
jgi:pimeloyl-ACP methyl ester carboxylesterase